MRRNWIVYWVRTPFRTTDPRMGYDYQRVKPQGDVYGRYWRLRRAWSRTGMHASTPGGDSATTWLWNRRGKCWVIG